MHTCSLYMTGSAWWAATVMGTLMAKRGRWWDPEVSKPKPEAWIDAVIDVGIWITWQNLKPETKTCKFEWIWHYLPIKTVIENALPPLRILVCQDHSVQLQVLISSIDAGPARMQECVPRYLHGGRASCAAAHPSLCGSWPRLRQVTNQPNWKERRTYVAQYFPALQRDG